MSKLKLKGYSLKDVAVVQASISYLNHRSNVNPMVWICGRQVYPIFVSPMASVTNQHNYTTWIDNDVTPVVPRSIRKSKDNPKGLTFDESMKIAKRTFVSISLNEAGNEMMNYDFDTINEKRYICIDIAHGTMSRVYDVCKSLKAKFGDSIELMTGNVANPDAYRYYAECGIDWMRVSIGTGSRCTSSCNVSIHYPSASLLDGLNEERKKYAHSHNGVAPTKIILDGGVEWFDDIQKALALGADAVMCGNIFARSEEACGEIVYAKSLKEATLGHYVTKEELQKAGYEKCDDGSYIKVTSTPKYCPFREYYGMSTRRAQKETGGDGSRTSEGISRPVPVEYSVSKWIDNMQSYLRSCMTYTNSRTIDELRNNAQLIILGGSGDAAYRK